MISTRHSCTLTWMVRNMPTPRRNAMVTVLAHKFGTERLLQFLDKIVDGTPIATAYEQLSGEKFEAFLSTMAGTIAALKTTK